MIKAVIFDLDDTLYNGDLLTESGLRQAVEEMVRKGLKCSVDEGFKRIKEIVERNPTGDRFRELANFCNQDDEKMINAGKNKYINSDFDSLNIFPDTIEILDTLCNKLKLILILITKGSKIQQMKKIDLLGIFEYFDSISVVEEGMKKKDFEFIVDKYGLKPNEVLVVGDRIDREIKDGNELGMISVRMLNGKYRFIEPKNKNEEPNYEIKRLKEILDIIENEN